MAIRKVEGISINDLDELVAKQLAENEEVLDEFLSKVADAIRDDARTTSDFIDKTRNLRRSIGKRKSKFPRGGYIVKASGRNRAEGADGAKGFHAWLVEFGHVKVLWGRRTSERVRPHPFMSNAVKRGKMFALQEIQRLNASRKK